jgi:hypothetical protein
MRKQQLAKMPDVFPSSKLHRTMIQGVSRMKGTSEDYSKGANDNGIQQTQPTGKTGTLAATGLRMPEQRHDHQGVV